MEYLENNLKEEVRRKLLPGSAENNMEFKDFMSTNLFHQIFD